jgi:hypothetical protein
MGGGQGVGESEGRRWAGEGRGWVRARAGDGRARAGGGWVRGSVGGWAAGGDIRMSGSGMRQWHCGWVQCCCLPS